MADDSGESFWLSPEKRAVIPLENFRISKTLAQRIRSGRFPITFNQAFDPVVEACARRPRTWISKEIKSAYGALHRRGGAHSVEAWREGKLAGGVYGVAIGGAFMAESMFHDARDAGMAALAALVERLRDRGFELLDVQFLTAHLVRCGAVEISRQEYLRRLAKASGLPRRF